jgi:hypothetical protein
MTPHSYSLAEATAELRRQQEQLQAASTRLREISTKSMAFGEAGDTAQRINENLQDGLEVLNVGNEKYGAAFNQTFLAPAIAAASQPLLGLKSGMTSTVQNLQNTASLYTKFNEVNTDLSSELG